MDRVRPAGLALAVWARLRLRQGACERRGGILNPDEYQQLRLLIEAQKPRALRKYLDYAERLRRGQGMDELSRWLAKILSDDGQVYGLEDKGLAFEVCACEALARAWPELGLPEAPLAVAGPVDRTWLYRHLLSPGNSPERRTTFAALLRQRYRRHWTWLSERWDQAEVLPPCEPVPAFQQLLEEMDSLDPLDLGASAPGGALEDLRQELEQSRADLERLREYLEAARDRAEASLGRCRELEEEARALRRTLGQEGEAREKLRAERSRRITSEREVAEASSEVERLRGELVKQEQRLRQMAARLAGAAKGPVSMRVTLAELQALSPEEVLGVEAGAGAEEVGQVRRRFASAFHSDRTGQLPEWVRDLFDQVLGAVNSACDRLGR